MKAEDAFKAFSQADLGTYGTTRPGENRLWEKVHLLEHSEDPLAIDPSHPASHVIIGIPEDIGPRANLGQGGAHGAWESFLGKFLNVQANRFGVAERTIMGGHVQVDDLLEASRHLDPKKEEDLAELRKFTARMDERVTPVIRRIIEAGKCPVIIGGGHNNAYGALRGTCEGYRTQGVLDEEQGMACLNLDPHADLRQQEGRHSGNGFTYAFEENYLERYAMLGLHYNYNPESIIQRAEGAPTNFHLTYFEEMLAERQQDEALNGALEFLVKEKRPLGLEIDLDSIAGMAVSAETPSGFHENDIRRFIKGVCAQKPLSYVHLAEGAPANKPGYQDHVGKALAYLASDAIRWSIDPV